MTDHSVSDTPYRRRLDERVTTIATTPGATIGSVIRGSRGAFPTLVYERLRERGIADRLPTGDLEPADAPDAARTPELHPLDYEWYFTEDTATTIANALAERGPPVLCLGAPTVASRLARRGVSVTLVDRSEQLAERAATQPASLRFLQQDVHEPVALESAYPVAFFDPPWYPEHTEAWLYRACQHVRPGGRLSFVLFPPLTRPGATEQRRDLLETARRVGSVSVDEDAVAYRTPAFERRVLRNSEVPVVGNWRTADLVHVDVSDPAALSDPPAVDDGPDWETFVTNGQVVKLRREVVGETTDVLAPIESCDGYVLPSVSRRDARRQHVDLWTSRNRVARVGDRTAVVEALRSLERGTAVSELSTAEFSAGLSAERRDALATQFAAILE
ncbi:class I SAM-dependent methyltransferase [Natrinema salaciae]|uniref:Methyltransferase domain-containing protein n=1 Tax=Natrinema salaciae TaxID=1186196 RepID=A0A1H9CG19_9EURY|nr:class I SAM-dependent methyltransferase [Natrinema salaciae]SEP99693.1 hypothetical protein SAMN04489841_1033 [Natrinema salaciae]